MSRLASLVVLVVLVVLGCGGDKTAAPPPAPVAAAAAPAGAAAFWNWFTAHAVALRAEKDVRKTMDAIGAEIDKPYPGVFAEIGGDGDDRTLVLSADGKRELFPQVQELYAARPTVPGWTIVAFRQRAKPGEPALTIEMGSNKLDPATVKFVATPAAGKLDIVVYIPGFTTNDEMGQIGYILLDHTLGEYDVETKVAGIEFAALDKAPAAAKALPELPEVVDALH